MTKKIYCVYCGVKNDITNKKCSKCHKELDPKNTPFKDYLIDKVKDKIDGDIKDNIFSLIIDYIKTHLYGTVITCSIIFTTVSMVVSTSYNSGRFEVVDTKPNATMNIKYLGEGKNSKEVMMAYVNAVNEGDLSKIKSYELKQFYTDIYKDIQELSTDKILNDNVLFQDRKILLSNDLGYYMGGLIGPEGEETGIFDGNTIMRHSVMVNYCAGTPCKAAGHYFSISYAVELIEIDGNFYVIGTEVEEGSAAHDIDNYVAYDYMIKYKGDTSKFTREELSKAS